MITSNSYITATDARNNFFDLLDQVKKGPYPINITVKGIPEAVVMSKEDYEGWLATIETLSDPELMEAIRQGDEDIKAGRYKSWDEVKKDLSKDSYLIADKGKKKYTVRHVSNISLKQGRKRSKKTG